MLYSSLYHPALKSVKFKLNVISIEFPMTLSFFVYNNFNNNFNILYDGIKLCILKDCKLSPNKKKFQVPPPKAQI